MSYIPSSPTVGNAVCSVCMRLPNAWIQVTPLGGNITYLNTQHMVEISIDPDDELVVLRFYEGTHTKIAESLSAVFDQMLSGGT